MAWRGNDLHAFKFVGLAHASKVTKLRYIFLSCMANEPIRRFQIIVDQVLVVQCAEPSAHLVRQFLQKRYVL